MRSSQQIRTVSVRVYVAYGVAYAIRMRSVYTQRGERAQCLIKHAKHTAYAKRIAELEGVQIPHNLLSCDEVERVFCVYVLNARSPFAYTSCGQWPE